MYGEKAHGLPGRIADVQGNKLMPAVADSDCMSQLGSREGYRVEDWRHEQRGERRWLVLELTQAPDRARCCSGCGHGR